MLVETMQRRGVVPFVITCSALISACEKSRESLQALKLFENNAAARRGALCDHLQCLNQCMRKGQGVRAGPLMLVETMQRRGVVPFMITCSALISACEKSRESLQAEAP